MAVEFWFEFASTYSYPAAMRIEDLAGERGVEILWRPFLLGPIFHEQGWDDSPFNLYPAQGALHGARSGACLPGSSGPPHTPVAVSAKRAPRGSRRLSLRERILAAGVRSECVPRGGREHGGDQRTVISPVMPASSWPGTSQRNRKVPALSGVKRTVTLRPGPMVSVCTPSVGMCRLCDIRPWFSKTSTTCWPDSRSIRSGANSRPCSADTVTRCDWPSGLRVSSAFFFAR